MVSLWSDGLWFVDAHEYWAPDYKFDMRMRTRHRLRRRFVAWEIVEVFTLSPRDRAVVYVLVPYRWIGQEPSRLLMVPSRFAFAYYSRLMLCGHEADKAHI